MASRFLHEPNYIPTSQNIQELSTHASLHNSRCAQTTQERTWNLWEYRVNWSDCVAVGTMPTNITLHRPWLVSTVRSRVLDPGEITEYWSGKQRSNRMTGEDDEGCAYEDDAEYTCICRPTTVRHHSGLHKQLLIDSLDQNSPSRFWMATNRNARIRPKGGGVIYDACTFRYNLSVC